MKQCQGVVYAVKKENREEDKDSLQMFEIDG